MESNTRRLNGRADVVRWSDVVIHHVGYQDLSLRRKKLQRDVRLLHQDHAEHPDDPFILFNLGSVHQELGQLHQALPLLRRSLELSHPSDSIVRKLYALITQAHRQLGQHHEALAVCEAGRRLYPDDIELLFQEGVIRHALGDLATAETCLQQCLSAGRGEHFASVDAGLRRYKARHNLAIVYRDQGRLADAERQWLAGVEQQSNFVPGWLGLGEIAIAQGRWEDAERTAARLQHDFEAPLDAAVLRGRVHLARREFAAAQELLRHTAEQFPDAVWPRVILSHACLQEGRDWNAAEEALSDVLLLDPSNREARHNLAVLWERSKADDEPGSLRNRYHAGCTTPSDIHEHLPLLFALARRCRHVTEMGTRHGISTIALLHAQPETLICYDKERDSQVDELQQLAGRTRFVFHQADTLAMEIEETDLLFIDTLHVYEQLKKELRLHAGKVRRFIALHAATTYGEQGEEEGRLGLWLAIEEFLSASAFRLRLYVHNNHGLTILGRLPGISE